jgi:hypothetical protein
LVWLFIIIVGSGDLRQMGIHLPLESTVIPAS